MDKILCSLGFHRWRKKRGHFEAYSNVKEYDYVCQRCGKTRHTIEPR